MTVLATLMLGATLAFVQGVQVEITDPPEGHPVFGTVTVAAAIESEDPVSQVSFFVDGRKVGDLSTPPFELVADVGMENTEHSFRVMARTRSGKVGEALLTTPRIPVNEVVTFELQQLYVTVSGNGGRVLDLRRSDFQVLDNGDSQEIMSFARGDLPLTAVILLDSSISMQGQRLQAAIQGAKAFFRAMRPLDEGRLMVFADTTILATPFTSVPEILTAGLDGITAGGGTALNDHLYVALKVLEERQGRRVVVVLSDGVDSHSALSMRQVLAKARQSQAIVYWVRLQDAGPTFSLDGSRIFSSWHGDRWYREHISLLGDAVTESGGRIAAIRRLDEIVPAFRDIFLELRQQYVLGYYPREQRNDGGWRTVEVRVARRGATVSTRRGYLDF